MYATVTESVAPSASAAEAAECYQRAGLFWMSDVLSPAETDELRAAAQDRQFHIAPMQAPSTKSCGDPAGHPKYSPGVQLK